MKRLTLLLAFAALSLRAQPPKNDLRLDLGFESIADANLRPLLWTTRGEGHSMQIDFSERYEGRSSLLIKSKPEEIGKTPFALVVKTVESMFKGQFVELSGYLKLDSVVGSTGLYLLISGKDGAISYDGMDSLKLQGTKSWTQFSIRLPLTDAATAIHFGAFQSGTGCTWVDKLQLRVDQIDISLAPIKVGYIPVESMESVRNRSQREAFLSKFGSVFTSVTLEKDNTSKVTTVPANFSFDPFYKKYLNAAGLPIIGSNNVSDEAFYKVRAVITMMLAKLPLVRKKLVENHARIAIIAKNELTRDLPEHKEMDEAMNWRGRGFGGNVVSPLTSCAEENILCLTQDPWASEDILIHEFAHTMDEMGIKFIDKYFENKLNEIYSQALADGLWKNTYAISNPSEYFAEGVQSWFNVNPEGNPADGIHNAVGTRSKLKSYDPRLHQLISLYFSADEPNASCHQPKTKLNKALNFSDAWRPKPTNR